MVQSEELAGKGGETGVPGCESVARSLRESFTGKDLVACFRPVFSKVVLCERRQGSSKWLEVSES